MKLQCQYMQRSDNKTPCATELDQAHRVERSNGSVFYICPVCERSNRWVFSKTIDGQEVGHLAKMGPRESRGLVKYSIMLPPDACDKLKAKGSEITRIFLVDFANM